jgi:hypothetical protein
MKGWKRYGMAAVVAATGLLGGCSSGDSAEDGPQGGGEAFSFGGISAEQDQAVMKDVGDLIQLLTPEEHALDLIVDNIGAEKDGKKFSTDLVMETLSTFDLSFGLAEGLFEQDAKDGTVPAHDTRVVQMLNFWRPYDQEIDADVGTKSTDPVEVNTMVKKLRDEARDELVALNQMKPAL